MFVCCGQAEERRASTWGMRSGWVSLWAAAVLPSALGTAAGWTGVLRHRCRRSALAQAQLAHPQQLPDPWLDVEVVDVDHFLLVHLAQQERVTTCRIKRNVPTPRTFQSLMVLSFVDSSMRVLFELLHQRTLLIFSSISRLFR